MEPTGHAVRIHPLKVCLAHTVDLAGEGHGEGRRRSQLTGSRARPTLYDMFNETVDPKHLICMLPAIPATQGLLLSTGWELPTMPTKPTCYAWLP